MKITKIDAYLVEDKDEPFNWQIGRPGSGDGRGTNTSYSCVIRVCTDNGVDGFAFGSPGRIVMDLVERRIAPELLGKNPLNTEFLWERIWDIDRIEKFPIYILGLADVALWDIKGKVAGLPVYQLLGGYRESLPAYASTTSYDTVEQYLAVVDAAINAGYSSIKLHLRQRDVRSNAELCRQVRRFVGDDFSLTLDASALWNYTDSLWFGRVLEELAFEWYEEPMREYDLDSYTRLCAELDIPILAAECPEGAHWNAGEFIRRHACDIMRTSTGMKGGFTGAIKVAHLAESYGMKAEVHGGGWANLNLGLAIPNNTYYEDLVISPEQIKKKSEGEIPVKDGYVRIPEGITGIGWTVDIKEIEARALQTASFSN